MRCRSLRRICFTVALFVLAHNFRFSELIVIKLAFFLNEQIRILTSKIEVDALELRCLQIRQVQSDECCIVFEALSFLEMSSHDHRSILELNHVLRQFNHPISRDILNDLVLLRLVSSLFKSRKLLDCPSLNAVVFEKVTFVRDKPHA
jgi:hypothetical protein